MRHPYILCLLVCQLSLNLYACGNVATLPEIDGLTAISVSMSI